jgi:hypothetical protein
VGKANGRFAADRRPGSSSKFDIGELLPVAVRHDNAGVQFFEAQIKGTECGH